MSTRKDEAVRPLWKRRIGLTAAIATAAMASMVAASPSFAEASADVPRTEQETIDALTALLPGDLVITESYGSGLDEGADTYASVTAEDGSGTVSFDLNAHRWATEDWRDIAGCQGFGEPEEGFTCEDTTLDDGSILSLVTYDYEDEGYPEEGIEPSHTRGWEAWLEGPGGSDLEQPGGRAVVLSEYRDLTDEADPGAYVPPVDLDQLAEVVQAPVWQDVLDAADAEYGAPEDFEEVPSSDVPADQLRDTFRSLAPEGLEIVDVENEAGETGHGSVTVDDGEGPGLVEITAYDASWREDVEAGSVEGVELESEGVEVVAEDELADGPDCQDTTLEDGTVVSVCDWPASDEDPLAMNWAVVTYPDGSSLDITAYNVPNWDAEPTRADAPLSGEQLAEIATADEWRALLG
ncbi:hypothetical protein [Streptomyces hainanensis]|uniref:Uncharacterized protein n=1 Tax=Streptomyces hainanensis TaxID=402648 RepID=A0A4R4T8P2_9ACTN|nr:hypothetical protein [Streptomyces hainanensis]TDC72346.1 hypothetical protein E1283_21955 [Streptomyces hainanensis]